MIGKRGGTVKLRGARLRMCLQQFENPEIDYAARGLYGERSRKDRIMVDKFRLPIGFDVS